MRNIYIGVSTIVLFISVTLSANPFPCPSCGIEKYFYVHPNGDPYPGCSCVGYCDLCGQFDSLLEGHLDGCPSNSPACPESSSCQPYTCPRCLLSYCNTPGDGHLNHIIYSLTVTSPCGVTFTYYYCESKSIPTYSSNEAAISAYYGADYNICETLTCPDCNYTRCVKHKDDDHSCPGFSCTAGTPGCDSPYANGVYSHSNDICTFTCTKCNKSRSVSGINVHIPGCDRYVESGTEGDSGDNDDSGEDDSSGGDSGGSGENGGDGVGEQLPALPEGVVAEFAQEIVSSGYDSGHGEISDRDISDRLNHPYSNSSSGNVPEGVAPVITIPMSNISAGYLSDIILDFNSSELSYVISFFRMFECGALIALSIMALNKIISSFEH